MSAVAPSTPATAERSRATSSTVAAMGPVWWRVSSMGKTPVVRNEAVGSLEAVDAAPGGGDPYRASLVAADGHVTFAARDEGGATARGAAYRAAVVVGVEDEPGVARVAAAREAKRVADGLADDLTSRIEDAGDDCRVGRGDEPF